MDKIKFLQLTYFTLAILGLVITEYFNYQYYLQSDQLDILGWFTGGYVNPAAASLSSDAYVTFLAVCIFFIVEAKRLEIKFGWIYILGGLFISFAFVFPLFLMVRERQIANKSLSDEKLNIT